MTLALPKGKWESHSYDEGVVLDDGLKHETCQIEVSPEPPGYREPLRHRPQIVFSEPFALQEPCACKGDDGTPERRDCLAKRPRYSPSPTPRRPTRTTCR